MSDIELLFHNFLKENLSPGPCRPEDISLLNGCRQLCEVTGEGVYQELFVQKMDSAVDSGGNVLMQHAEPENCKIHNFGMGRNLFWMAGHSGEEKYKTAVEREIVLTKDLCRKLADSGQADGRQLYLTQPFYMEYETKCHNKAEYKEIVKLLASEQETKVWTETEAALKDTAWYLMALVDVTGCMSMEIYEHYRFLEEILKRIVRQYTGFGKDLPYSERKDFCSMFGYVILKACSQKNLNAEKYGDMGKKLVESVINSSDLKNCEETGVLMMAYAQLLSFRAKADSL